MNIDSRKSQLIIEVLDGDDFELHITATNGRYFGTTEVYAHEKALEIFANSLTSYPAGYIGVEVCLEDRLEGRTEGRDKVKLEIIVLPSAIDRFQKELFGLIAGVSEVATLYGKDSPY